MKSHFVMMLGVVSKGLCFNNEGKKEKFQDLAVTLADSI